MKKIIKIINFMSIISILSTSVFAKSFCINKSGNRATLDYVDNGLYLDYKYGRFFFKLIKSHSDPTPGSEYSYAEYGSDTHKIIEEYFDLSGDMILISPNGYKTKYNCHMLWAPEGY